MIDELRQFPWAAVTSIGLCLGYLIRVSMDYAAQKKAQEGLLTREEYLRDQRTREDVLLAKVRQMILDLGG